MGINCNDSKIKRISNFPEENMLINFRCNNIKKPNQKNKNFQLYDISNDCSNLYTSFNRNKTKKVPFSTSSLGEKKQSKMKLSNQRKKKNKYFEKKIPQYFKINNIKRKSRHSKYRNSYASQLCNVVGPLDRKIDSNILNKSYIKCHLNNKTNDSCESIIESVPVRLANCPIFCGSTNIKEKYKGSKLKGKRLISCIGKGETEKDKVDRIYKNNKHEDVNKIDLNYKKNMNKLRDKSYSFTIKNKNIDENFKYLINTQITKEETKGVSNSKKAGGNIVLKGNVYKIANNHRLEENIKNENKSCEKIKKNNKHIKKRIEEYPIVDSTKSYIRDGNKISINNEKNNESSFSSFSSACSDENSSYEVSIFGELDINYDLDSNKSDTLMHENSKNMASKNYRSYKRNINRSTTKNKDIESGIAERNKKKEKCKNCDSSIKESITINDGLSNAHKINNFNHARNSEKYADLAKMRYYETKKKNFIQNSKKYDSKRFEPAEWESRSRANRDSRSSGSSKGSVRDRCRRCIERKRDRNCNKISDMNYKKGYKQKKEMNHEEEDDERRKKMELYLKRKIDLKKNKDKMDKYKTIYGVPKGKRIENINEPKNIEAYKKINDIKTDKIRRNSDIRIGNEIRSRNKIEISSSNDPNKIISEEKLYNNEDYNEKKKDKFYEIYFGCKKLDKINYKKGIENAKKKIYNIKIINDNSKYIREMEEDALIKNIDMQETEIEEDLHSTKYSSDMITPNDKNGNGKKYSSKYDTHYEKHYSYSSDEKDKNRLSKSHIKNGINNNWGSRKNETIGDFNEYDKGMKKKKNIEIVQSDSEHFKIRDELKLPINLLNIQNEKNKKCKTLSHAPPKVINSVGKIMSENKRKNWKDSRNIQNLSKAKSSNLYEIILKKKKQENKNCIIDSTISSFPSTYCHIEEKGRNNYAYVCKSYETEENNYYPDANSVNKNRHIFSSINNSFKAKEDEKSKNKIKSNKKGIKNENKKNSQNLKQNKTWHTIPIEEKMFLSKSTQNSGGEIYSLNCQNSVFTFPHEYLDTSENFRSFKKSRSICSGICVGNGKDNETFRSSSDNSMTYIKKQNPHKNDATFKLRAHSINNKMKEKTNDKKINELYFYKMGENKNFRHTSNCFLSRCSPKWNKKINSENINCYSCILKDSNKNRHQNNMCNKFNFCSEVPNEMQKINNIKIRCLSKSGTYKNEFCKNYLFSPCKNSVKTNSKNDRTKSLFSKLFSYIKKNSLCNEKKYKDSIKRNKSEAFPFCKTKKNIKPPHYICNNRSRSSGYFIDVYPIKNGVRNNCHVCCCNKFMVNKNPALIHVPSDVKYIIDVPDGCEKNKLDNKLFIDKTIENEIKKSTLDLNGKAKDNYYATKTSTNLRRGIKCDNVFTKNGVTNDGYMKRVLPKGGEKRNVKGVVKKGAMKNNCKYVLKINDHNHNNNTLPCNGTTINCKTKILKNNNEHINKSISENEIDCPKIEKPNFLKLNLFDEKYETVKQSPKKMNTNNDLAKNRGAKRTSKYVSKLTKLQTMKEEGNTFRKNLNNINCGYSNLCRNRHPKSSINQIAKDIDRDIFIDTNDSYIINDQIVGNIGTVCNKSGENNNEKIGNNYGKTNTFDESAQMNNPNKGYKIFVVRKGDRNKSAMGKNIFSNGVIENKLPLTNSENRRGTKYVENKEHNFCKCKNDYNCNCEGINYKNNIALDSMEGETIDNYSSCSNENIYLWGNNNIIKNEMDNYRDEMINYSKEKGNNIEEIENDIKMNKPIKECLNAPLNCLNKKLNSSAENIIKKIILNYKNVNLKNMNNDKLNNHETKASVNKCINNKNFQINKKNIQKNIKNKLHLKVNKNVNNEKSDNIVNDMPNIRHTQNTDGNFVLKNNNINSERNIDIKANNNKTGIEHYKYEQFRKKNYNIINNASCSYNDCIYPDPKIYFLNNDESCIIIEYPSIKYYVVCP